MSDLHLNKRFCFHYVCSISDFAGGETSSYLQHIILRHTAFCKRGEEIIILKQNTYLKQNSPKSFSNELFLRKAMEMHIYSSCILKL